MNAIIGDNGIITRAQEANMQSSIASLEEFLQLKYTENYEEVMEIQSKVSALSSVFPGYFYDPRIDGYGSVNYVTDAEGHALYLINKSGLPSEISQSLFGGDCGTSKTGAERYIDFVNLNDVYGVTSDLKVYYCSGNGEFLGIASKDNLDEDTTSRVVLKNTNPLAKLIKNDGTDLTVADTQSVRNLVIDNNSDVASLEDLYVLGSLEDLTLKNLNLSDLSGIQTVARLNRVFLSNCVIGNYSALSSVSKLKYFYVYDLDDAELVKICNGIKDATYNDLQYLAFVGRDDGISSVGYGADDYGIGATRTASKYITDLTPLSSLGDSCIGNVKYMNLQCNQITDKLGVNGSVEKYALENLSKFKNIYLLRVEGNKLTSLRGLESMNNLTYLFAFFNQLGKYETYNQSGTTDIEKGKDEYNALFSLANKSNLSYLYLSGNSELKWVSYLSTCSALKSLHFGEGKFENDECVSMIDSEVIKLKNIFKNCGTNRTCPGKYWLCFLDENDSNLNISLKDQTITEEQFKSLSEYQNIKYLNLENIKIKNLGGALVNNKEEINQLSNDVLKHIRNLQYLCVASNSSSSFYNWNSLEFLKGVDINSANDDINLVELAAFGTKLSTKEEKDGSWVEYDNGLKMLSKKRENSEDNYCGSLMVLSINEEHTELSDFNDCIKRVIGSSTVGSTFGYGNGFYTNNKNLIESIKNCTGFTKIYLTCLTGKDWKIDLSSFTQLTTFEHSTNKLRSELVLPSSVTRLCLSGFEGKCDIDKLDNFTLILGWSTKENAKQLLSTVGKTSVIKELMLSPFYVLEGDVDFGFFKEIYDLRGCCLNVTRLYDNGSYNVDQSLISLDGVQYITGLTYFELMGDKTPNLKDIGDLESQANTLTRLDLSNCSVSNASVVSKLTKLNYLDLQNNCLATYVELDSGKWWTIPEICKRMKLNATSGKVTLKLKENPSIIDWSEYENNTAIWSSDSNYGI